MEKLNFNGREFLYEIERYDCGDYGVWDCFKTHFYDPKPIIKVRKKYFIFGEKIEVKSYTKLFTLDYSIKSPAKLKEDIRSDIETYVKLLDRKDEINRGDII